MLTIDASSGLGNGFVMADDTGRGPWTDWSARELAQRTGGELMQGPGDARAAGVSIDSRSLRPGELFIAIRGPRHDGHAFLHAAMERGATGAFVDRRWQDPGGLPADRFFVRVADTHQALKDLAAAHRRGWMGSLIGVTGSMGKTTAKEFCAQILGLRYRVSRSPGNFNNLYGLPLSLLAVKEEIDIGVFELGMSAPGEIAEMCRIARPDVGIITNIAPVHLEFLGSLDAIAAAKGELAAGLPAQGTLIYNADDPLVCRIAEGFAGHKIPFGLSSNAAIRASNLEVTGFEETRFRLSLKGVSRSAAVPHAGAHYVMNALAAVAAGLHYRVDEECILAELRNLAGAAMRGRIVRFREGFTVIDDSYNSNPQALKGMIETLAGLSGSGRCVVVAGEMLELGPESEALHRECGAWAAGLCVGLLVGVRAAARGIVEGAIRAGMPEEKTRFFEEVEEAAEFVAGTLRRGDAVLVKGSRGVRLERVVQRLRSRFEEQEA